MHKASSFTLQNSACLHVPRKQAFSELGTTIRRLNIAVLIAQVLLLQVNLSESVYRTWLAECGVAVQEPHAEVKRHLVSFNLSIFCPLRAGELAIHIASYNRHRSAPSHHCKYTGKDFQTCRLCH